MISDLWSEAKISNLLTLHGVCWNIGILGRGIQKWHYLSFWPLRDHQISFLNSLTQKTYILINIMENRRIQILASDQRSEVIWWPLRGQNEKIMSFLDSLTQETYILIYIMQNEWIQNFGLWHLVTCMRSKSKNVIFEFLWPRKPIF